MPYPDLKPRVDGYSWLYTALTFVLFLMSTLFAAGSPEKVLITDVALVDAPYMALVMHKYLTATPTKISLETLGSYEMSTKSVLTNKFGIDNLNTAVTSLFENTMAAKLLVNKQFTGHKDATVIKMASPLWAYQHNLHLHESSYCSNAAITDAMNLNMAVVNPVLTTQPDLTANKYKCAPAYPTTIDYQQCYANYTSRKEVMIAFAVISGLLWAVSTFFYICRASYPGGGSDGYYGLEYTPYVQQCSMVFYLVAVCFISVSISTDFPTLLNDTTCPAKMTGLATAYTYLLVLYIGVYVVLAMHAICFYIEVCDIKYSPEWLLPSQPAKIEQVKYGGDYSCQFP